MSRSSSIRFTFFVKLINVYFFPISKVAQPRMKKISTDDAAKFRKDILDPTNDEIQEQPLIHQTDSESMEEDTSDFVKGNTNRKISRLQRSKKISDGSLSDGIFTL